MNFEKALQALKEGKIIKCNRSGNIYKNMPHMQSGRKSINKLIDNNTWQLVDTLPEYEIMSEDWEIVDERD